MVTWYYQIPARRRQGAVMGYSWYIVQAHVARAVGVAPDQVRQLNDAEAAALGLDEQEPDIITATCPTCAG